MLVDLSEGDLTEDAGSKPLLSVLLLEACQVIPRFVVSNKQENSVQERQLSESEAVGQSGVVSRFRWKSDLPEGRSL